MYSSASNARSDPSSGRRKMLLIAALCLAPLVAAWIAFYYLQPGGGVNYGELIPAHPLIDPPLRHLDGRPFRLSELKGKWIMLQLDTADCGEACRAKLYNMRQVRLTQGREMERLERVWLILDDAPLETLLMREYDGTRLLRARGSPLLAEFPDGGKLRDPIYLIDPLGNLMLRFPRNADPSRMKKDIARLLQVSRTG